MGQPTERYIPMAEWGRDHWRQLAYVEAIAVDMGGFQVGFDPRMTANRRHFRVMYEQCPEPKRASHLPAFRAMVMRPEHASRMAGGVQPDPQHDDWCCVQDFAAEGLFTVGPEGVEPGEFLHLSPKGLDLVGALRKFKAAGGQYAQFQAASVDEAVAKAEQQVAS